MVAAPAIDEDIARCGSRDRSTDEYPIPIDGLIGRGRHNRYRHPVDSVYETACCVWFPAWSVAMNVNVFAPGWRFTAKSKVDEWEICVPSEPIIVTWIASSKLPTILV